MVGRRKKVDKNKRMKHVGLEKQKILLYNSLRVILEFYTSTIFDLNVL